LIWFLFFLLEYREVYATVATMLHKVRVSSEIMVIAMLKHKNAAFGQ
jgi:hypothetical protein